MQEIQENIYRIREVIEDSESYAQKMLYYRGKGNCRKMKKYFELVSDGLKDAGILHEMLVEDWHRYSEPTNQERELFEITNSEYSEKTAALRKLLLRSKKIRSHFVHKTNRSTTVSR